MRILLILLAISICACAPFQDSPFSDQLLRKERNLNGENLKKMSLVDVEADGVIRIAVFADSHQNYKDLDQVIHQINQTADVDFVVNLGDLTNNGYNLEYDQFLESYAVVQKPVFTVIGNHDAIGAGPALFGKAFGPKNYFFETPTYRFIFFHSANLEDPAGFDPAWLQARIDETTKKVIIFSHVEFTDPDRFKVGLATTMLHIIQSSNVPLILNGHNHVFEIDGDPTWHATLLQAPRTENSQWLILELQGNTLTIKRINNGEVLSLPLPN